MWRAHRVQRSSRQSATRLLRTCWSSTGHATCDAECIRFMATKHTITPRGALLKSHLHGGVVVRRTRIAAPPAERPMRTVCAWCVEHDRPAAVLVDVPIDDRGLSHGGCAPLRCGPLHSRADGAAAG